MVDSGGGMDGEGEALELEPMLRRKGAGWGCVDSRRAAGYDSDRWDNNDGFDDDSPVEQANTSGYSSSRSAVTYV